MFDESGKISGYIVRFGSVEDKDLQGEYFTKDTNFNIDAYTFYDILYNNVFVGTAYNIKTDKIGVSIEANIHSRFLNSEETLLEYGLGNLDEKILEYISNEVEKKNLVFVPVADTQSVEVDDDGKIKSYHISNISLTATPADPDLKFKKYHY